MLDDRGIDVHSLQGQETCLHSVQTDSEIESRSPSYSVGIVWAYCLGVKRPRREDNHSPPSSSHVKNKSYILHSHTSLHAVNRQNSRFSISASIYHEAYSFVGYDAVWSVRNKLSFYMNVLFHSSGCVRALMMEAADFTYFFQTTRRHFQEEFFIASIGTASNPTYTVLFESSRDGKETSVDGKY